MFGPKRYEKKQINEKRNTILKLDIICDTASKKCVLLSVKCNKISQTIDLYIFNIISNNIYFTNTHTKTKKE